MKNNKKGFTLIELLVVIAIIGLLSTLAVVSLNNARQKSRDARRVADVKQIQTALELYYNDATAYPATAVVAPGLALSYTSGGNTTTYMASIPDDPQNAGTYTYTDGGGDTTTYTLEYTLEGDTGGISAGVRTATPAGICDDPGC